MQSPNNTLGFRDSFVEEAKVIAEQLQGHGGTEDDVSTIQAELPPLHFTSSILDSPASEQGQVQSSDSPLPASALEPGQEPSPATPSEQGLPFLKELPVLEEAASPAEPVKWQLNVTMELSSQSPDSVRDANPHPLAPQPSSELSKTYLLSLGLSPIPWAQPESNQPPDDRASGEEGLLTVQDLSDVSTNKTFLFSLATFVTSTPQGALQEQKLLKGASAFPFPESPTAQEVPSMTETNQPSAIRAQGPLAVKGNPVKATAKSGPLGKAVQEKRSLGGGPLAVSKRGHQALPLPSQKRWSAVPYKTSGLPVLLKSKRECLAPPGPRQQKGRNSEAGRMKEAEPSAKTGNNQPSAAKTSQLLRSKSVPPRFSLHQRGLSAREPKSRDPQAARNVKPLPPSQSTQSRAPSQTDEQPRKQDRKHQPSSRQTCPQCLVLQKQVEDLKSQLAAMQCLSGEFQGLPGSVQDPSTTNKGGTT